MDKTLVVSSFLALVLTAAMLSPAPALADVTATPTSLSLGTVKIGAASAANIVTISNSSPHALSILSISSTAPEFVVSSSAMPMSLPAHGSAMFQVMFQPNAPGSFTGNIAVNVQNKGRGTSAVNIAANGTAISPTQPLTYLLSSSTSTLTFVNTLVGSSSTQSIALTNSGTGTLTISQAATTGSGFAVASFSGPASLAPGSSLALTVNFAPTATGAVAGNLAIVSNATNSSVTIPLSGTGVLPQISVVPSSISFPNVSVGVTNTQSLTVRNTGTAPLTVTQATLAGTAFSYTGLALPLALSPGSSSTFTVAFTPVSASNFYANLSLVNNSSSSPVVISLAGTSVSPVLQLSSSPASLGFGSMTTGTSSSQTVTVTNTGNTSVSVSSISVTGAGFSPSAFTLPLTLAAGQSTTFAVAFAPASVGSMSGTLAVVSNATHSPLLIPLTGSGVAPVSHTVTLGWTPGSTLYAGFNIYRGSQTGGPYTRINLSLISTTSYTDTSVTAGQTYFYVATEEDSTGLESTYSPEASATIP